MKENLVLLIQKIIGIAMLIGTFLVTPYADGDVTFAIVTIPIGLMLLFSNFVFFEELLEEDDDYEDEGF